jgi:hypothetical protein
MLKVRSSVAVFILLFASHTIAETNFSVFAGYRGGGEFEDTISGQRLKLDEGESFGVSMSVPYSKNTKMEFVLSHQESRLLNDSAPAEVLVDLDIDYLHVGGLYIFPGKQVETYLVGTLGATYYRPGGGYTDKVRPSIGFGLGSFIYLTKSLGLKLEARGYTTFLDSDGAMFCGETGCRIIAVSSTIWQSELQAGLTFRF